MKKYLKIGLPILLLGVAFMLQHCSKDDVKTVGVPTILKSKFYPASGSGPVGSAVVLSGNFYSTLSSVPDVVKFNGITAQVLASDATTITAVVPVGATSGKITVSVNNYTGTSDFDFNVTSSVPPPFIVDFSPKTGYGVDGTAVDITGVNFAPTTGGNTVTVNGVAATVLSATATSLKVQLLPGTTSGNIEVVTSSSSTDATLSRKFTVPTPSVSKFTPSFSIVGSTVEVSGTNFSATASNNVVDFNGTSTTGITVSDPDKDGVRILVVKIPVGATTGKISVTVDGQKGTSSGVFTVN